MNLIKILNIATPQLLAKTLFPAEWQSPKHICLIEDKLLATFKNGKQRLIVNMPPRHGKSQFITKIFPLWWLLNRPSDRIIIASYNNSFAESFGRQILDSFKKISSTYNIMLSNSQKSKAEFVTNFNGGISAVGTGGSLTGKGANLIIVDDPIKNDTEANSVNARDSIYNWFTATLMTRLEPNGSIILVMTRWHEDDLTGRLLNSKGWDSIVLPALATKRDNLGRQVGGALWRERYNRSKLLKIKETLGSYWFSGLYQQSPSPAEGGLFKRLHFRYMEVADGIATSKDFTLSLANLDIYFACDLAVSTKATADYTVVVVFATDSDKNLLLLEVFREKIIPSHHVEVITNLYGRYKPILIGIETVQYQASLFHQLNSVGLPVTKLIPSKDKVTRALPLAAKFESGKIYFSKKMKNLEVIENELLNFPNGRNDDIVDALAYATAMLSMNSSVQPTGYRKSRPNLLKGF